MTIKTNIVYEIPKHLFNELNSKDFEHYSIEKYQLVAKMKKDFNYSNYQISRFIDRFKNNGIQEIYDQESEKQQTYVIYSPKKMYDVVKERKNHELNVASWLEDSSDQKELPL